MKLATQYCTFWLDNLFFGVRVDRVKEVVQFQSITKVPHAPSEVEGLINLRGDIITAINMRRLLLIQDDLLKDRHKHLIVKDLGGPVSLIVDDLGDVIDTQIHNFEHPPVTMDASIRDMVLAIYKMKNELLLILDIEQLIMGVENSHDMPIEA